MRSARNDGPEACQVTADLEPTPLPRTVHESIGAAFRPSSLATTAQSFPFRRPTSRELTFTPTWRRECLQRSECSLRSAESFGSSSSSLLCLCSLAFSRAGDNR